MATVAIMVGGAVLNAATFIGGNYLAKYLSGDSGQAALDEKKLTTWPLRSIRGTTPNTKRIARSSWTGLHNKITKRRKPSTISKTQTQPWRFIIRRTEQRWLCRRSPSSRTTTTHRAKVAMPKEPQFSDYYKPSPQQKNGELLFIGASTLALGYAAFRFL